MALDTYANLKTAIQEWARPGSVDVSFNNKVDDFIDLVEARLNLVLRHPRMITTATITTTANQQTASLPSDFLEAVSIERTDGGQLQRTGLEAMQGLYASVDRGAPTSVAIAGNGLVYFAPIPDGVYTCSLKYYQAIPALSDSNTTNWLLTLAPDIYLYGALLEAQEYIQNPERIARLNAKYGESTAALATNVARYKSFGASGGVKIVGVV